MRRQRFKVLYPEYFDISLTRSQGRRVPKKIAVSQPSIQKIIYALRKLEKDYEVEKDKRYPRTWWRSSGRVLVRGDPEESKAKLLVDIAKIARRLKQVEKKEKKEKVERKGKVRKRANVKTLSKKQRKK